MFYIYLNNLFYSKLVDDGESELKAGNKNYISTS